MSMQPMEPTVTDNESGQVNPPGQSALNFRIGTHAEFRQRMLDGLRNAIAGQAGGPPPLSALKTRSADDPAIALIDAWATVGDVLAFYQERIANEGFIRTASESGSLLHLSELVGHEPAPGLAASVDLAFSVEDAPGAPAIVTVPAGTKVQSIPGQGQLPQTFETGEALEARAEWNELRPIQFTDQIVSPGTTSLTCRGVTTGLKPGDAILIVHWQQGESIPDGDSVRQVRACEFRPLSGVEVKSEAGTTLVSWREQLGLNWEFDPVPTFFALRSRAALFGHNAPDPTTLSDQLQAKLKIDSKDTDDPVWSEFKMTSIASSGDVEIDLERVHPNIQPGGWLVLMDGTNVICGTVKSVSTVFRNDFLLSNQLTRVILRPIEAVTSLTDFGLRTTAAFFANEALTLAKTPLDEFFGYSTIALEDSVSALPAGRRLVLSGQPLDASHGTSVSEVAVVADCDGRLVHLRDNLKHHYVRSTVRIAGNVVPATHGESAPPEVLGSGNGKESFQRFPLTRPALTYLTSPTADGIASTLAVRVNGVLWSQVSTMAGKTQGDRVYTVRRNETGRSFVVFGDGKTGARLPSGQENVVASYRTGLGEVGNVQADSLTLLQSRPLGVRSVTNPLPASGGVSPETVAQTRNRCPKSTTTLGRVVTPGDYEDFARLFAGIGKAKAAMLWTGFNRLMHLTVADAAGNSPASEAAVRVALVDAIAAAGNRWQRCVVDGYVAKHFRLAATVWIDRDFDEINVLGAVRKALCSTFDFENRDFGQSVTASEVITTIQRVFGVVAVDLDELYPFVEQEAVGTGPLLTELPARLAYVDAQGTHPAELLTIDPSGIALSGRPIQR